MTIFQKLLVAPILSLLLFGSFLIYTYHSARQNRDAITEIKRDFIPVLELANDNITTFTALRDVFKDAVVTRESQWLEDGRQLRDKLNSNLDRLKGFNTLVTGPEIENLRSDLNRYYNHSNTLAATILSNPEALSADNALFHQVEYYHNLSNKGLEAFKSGVQARFHSTVGSIETSMARIMLTGVLMSLVLFITVLAITLWVSVSTRKQLLSLIDGVKELARGRTDFSRRLTISGKDELANLSHWFNRLADKMEQDYKAVETISITDKLTQLNNRNRTDSFFSQTLKTALTEGQPLSILMVDVDHFKRINDTHGHLRGDEVLIAVADILKKEAQPQEFIGRWGGEEFIVIIPGEAPLARARAERLRQAVKNHRFPEVGNITVSIGTATAMPGDSTDALLIRADGNLYEAKRQGRDQVIG